jgi:hypothetical protein
MATTCGQPTAPSPTHSRPARSAGSVHELSLAAFADRWPPATLGDVMLRCCVRSSAPAAKLTDWRALLAGSHSPHERQRVVVRRPVGMCPPVDQLGSRCRFVRSGVSCPVHQGRHQPTAGRCERPHQEPPSRHRRPRPGVSNRPDPDSGLRTLAAGSALSFLAISCRQERRVTCQPLSILSGPCPLRCAFTPTRTSSTSPTVRSRLTGSRTGRCLSMRYSLPRPFLSLTT